ncbi:MAG: 3-oxoacyl-ACP reductase FabG [Candidatus Rokubacteria bacterium]|nr:3-oxoacyl-ACP reductase FabG [Candidatus Rokubacteria bacterium]
MAGRVALVTGASRGFGRAIALAFGRAGADVVVNYRASGAQAEQVVAELQGLGRKAVAVQADVAREEAVRRLIEATLAGFDRLDVLVNNAGVMVRGSFLEVPIERYAEMLAINVTGTMLCSFHALPAMIERRYGRIINLSSQLATLGAVGGGGFAAYAGTKGAINALTKALAHEVGPHGITVNAIAPGSIETDMSRDVMTEEFKARRIQALPVRRMGTVEDVAHVAVFLASEASGFLTGQVIHASGGLVMG